MSKAVGAALGTFVFAPDTFRVFAEARVEAGDKQGSGQKLWPPCRHPTPHMA